MQQVLAERQQKTQGTIAKAILMKLQKDLLQFFKKIN